MLDVDLKAIQQINFTEKSRMRWKYTNVFIEETKETVSGFSKEILEVL